MRALSLSSTAHRALGYFPSSNMSLTSCLSSTLGLCRAYGTVSLAASLFPVREWDIWGISRSTPFSAVRVFWPILVARLDYLALRLRLVFASEKERTRALTTWGENLSPVGANPFQLDAVYRRWASASLKFISVRTRAIQCFYPGIDDLDVFGMHLSNSSYAKARFFSFASQREPTGPSIRHSIKRAQ